MSESTPMVQLAGEDLDYRRRLGFQLRIAGQMLLEFARYADRVGHTGALTTELAVRRARLPVGASPLYQARRLEVVRCFARHRAIFDPATEVPPLRLLGPAHRRTDPSLYSEAELAALLAAASRLASPTGLRPRTYATLIGLLICPGLRISEALKMSRGDVAWGQGWVMIRESKSHQSRLVPWHPTVVPVLRECARHRALLHPIARAESFFVSDRGSALPYSRVRQTFRKPCEPLPGPRRPDGRAPRIHDIRHTFGRRLRRWYADGVDLDPAVASLSTSLGHARVSDTSWYLTGIPELLDLAAGRFERSISLDLGDLLGTRRRSSPASPRWSGSSSASDSSPSRMPALAPWRPTVTWSAFCSTPSPIAGAGSRPPSPWRTWTPRQSWRSRIISSESAATPSLRGTCAWRRCARS